MSKSVIALYFAVIVLCAVVDLYLLYHIAYHLPYDSAVLIVFTSLHIMDFVLKVIVAKRRTHNKKH